MVWIPIPDIILLNDLYFLVLGCRHLIHIFSWNSAHQNKMAGPCTQVPFGCRYFYLYLFFAKKIFIWTAVYFVKQQRLKVSMLFHNDIIDLYLSSSMWVKDMVTLVCKGLNITPSLGSGHTLV